MPPKADTETSPPTTESPKASNEAPPSPTKIQKALAASGIDNNDSSQPSLSNKKFKSDIVTRIGGDSMFEFILIAFVDNLKKDDKLKRFYQNFDSQSLRIHQRTFFIQVFEDVPNQQDEDLDSIIALRHYTLINQGFKGKHFDLLVNHFVHAMDDSWVSEDVIRDAVCILYPFRRVFASDGEAEMKSLEGMEFLLPTVNRGEGDDIQVALNDEEPPPSTRTRGSRSKKEKPSRRVSTDDAVSSMKKSTLAQNGGGRRGSSNLFKKTMSGEGLTKMKLSIKKSLSGEGLTKMKKNLQRRVSGEKFIVPDEVQDAAGED